MTRLSCNTAAMCTAAIRTNTYTRTRHCHSVTACTVQCKHNIMYIPLEFGPVIGPFLVVRVSVPLSDENIKLHGDRESKNERTNRTYTLFVWAAVCNHAIPARCLPNCSRKPAAV